MEELKLMVPTYNGKWLMEPNSTLDDFGEPEVPVVVRPAEGVRIVLGTHDYDDIDKPDVQIERRHNGWAIFLRPLGGSDMSGYVYFLDDGRSFVVQERFGAPTVPIEMVEHEEAVAELDDILPSGPSCGPTLVIEKCLDEKPADCLQREVMGVPPATEPTATVQASMSQQVIKALECAEVALHGDSNDDEHDALIALIAALRKCNLVEYKTFSPEWIVEDFRGWAGLERGEHPDQEDIDIYVSEARPANSSPVDVFLLLRDWAETLPNSSRRPE